MPGARKSVITCSGPWTKESLLVRGNRYLARRGNTLVTAPTLNKWVSAGLIPPPVRRARGYRRGAAQDWSALAYRRMLQVAQLREQGCTRHDEQLLALWLGGARYPIHLIRPALRRVYARQIAAANHLAHTDQWGDQSTGMTPVARRSALSGLDIRFDLEQRLAPLATTLQRAGVELSDILQSDWLEALSGAWAWHLLIPHERAWAFVLRDLWVTAPAIVRKVLSSEEETLETVSGMLASPEEFLNPLLAAVDEASDQNSPNLRDWVAEIHATLDGLLRFAGVVLRDDPTVLEDLAHLAQLIAEGLDGFRVQVRSLSWSTEIDSAGDIHQTLLRMNPTESGESRRSWQG